MSFQCKGLFYLISFIFLNACGVKGKPQPPLEQPVIGRGEMVQHKKAKSDPTKKKKYQPSEPDWDEKDDFNEDSP